MQLKAKIMLPSLEEQQKLVSDLKEGGNFVQSSKRSNIVFCTLIRGITRKDAFYIPEEIQNLEYEIVFEAEETLPVGGVSSVVCGAKSGKPLKPYFIENDNMNKQPFAAHFNVPWSVSVVEVDSQKKITVSLYRAERKGDFVKTQASTVYQGGIAYSGVYLPAAQAALLKLMGEPVCYYDPIAWKFFNNHL